MILSQLRQMIAHLGVTALFCVNRYFLVAEEVRRAASWSAGCGNYDEGRLAISLQVQPLVVPISYFSHCIGSG